MYPIHTHIHVYVTHTHVYVFNTHTRICAPTRICGRVVPGGRTCRKHKYVYTYTYMYTFIRIYPCTCARIDVYIYTHTCVDEWHLGAGHALNCVVEEVGVASREPRRAYLYVDVDMYVYVYRNIRL